MIKSGDAVLKLKKAKANLKKKIVGLINIFDYH